MTSVINRPLEGVKIGMAALGCSKNNVDAELMLGELVRAGAVLTPDAADADAIIVNTCGFIESAKQESINCILEMSEYGVPVVVTGCLSGRYREELSSELTEAAAFLGVTASSEIVDAVVSVLGNERYECYKEPTVKGDYCGRVLTTPPYMAYVKIAEGCSNRCAYCAIPLIRGSLQSRTMEDIEAEVKALTAKGAKEIVLIAQDTTRYGEDIYGTAKLAELMRRVSKIEGVWMLRVLYCYPEAITDELIDVIAETPNIAKYIDMPIQHINDDVLLKMNRRNTKDSVYSAVKKIREKCDDFVLRTTLIAGFPEESYEAHREMLGAVTELRFDRLGVFAYSEEDGTPAAIRPQLPMEIRELRRDTLMQAQREVALMSNEKRIGRIYEVISEGGGRGRSYAEAPDIDGYIELDKDVPAGEVVRVKIVSAEEYDLKGEVL